MNLKITVLIILSFITFIYSSCSSVLFRPKIDQFVRIQAKINGRVEFLNEKNTDTLTVEIKEENYKIDNFVIPLLSESTTIDSTGKFEIMFSLSAINAKPQKLYPPPIEYTKVKPIKFFIYNHSKMDSVDKNINFYVTSTKADNESIPISKIDIVIK
jgi:hypothetical protein